MWTEGEKYSAKVIELSPVIACKTPCELEAVLSLPSVLETCVTRNSRTVRSFRDGYWSSAGPYDV
jgi:hypothetical protein